MDTKTQFRSWPSKPLEPSETYLNHMEAVYTHDAYNSLSIEGYRVTPELIESIRSGSWNPNENAQDQQEIAAMAAKGYLAAFRMVKKSVACVLQRERAGQVFHRDYASRFGRAYCSPITSPATAAHQSTYALRAMSRPPMKRLMPPWVPCLICCKAKHRALCRIHPRRDARRLDERTRT